VDRKTKTRELEEETPMTGPKIIDGKKIAADVRAEVAAEVQRLIKEHGLKPGLAVVLVGEDPASKVYVKNKAQQTVEVGMNSWEHKLTRRDERGRRAGPRQQAQ
jgi:5,10-methylene-tetrahydrofolate dehydrogenase/methenyl tetrahydrofolate cyclohydrolase